MADPAAKRREERVKLAASALSNVGIAFIVAGLVSPSIGGHVNVWTGMGSVLLGFGFHFLAQCVLHYVVADTPQDGFGARNELAADLDVCGSAHHSRRDDRGNVRDHPRGRTAEEEKEALSRCPA